MQKQDYILWLPSWYPNEREPFLGDFIQRHARAASFHQPITAIFFTQYGETASVEEKIVKTTTENLREIIVYVPFKPLGVRLIDRLRYNRFFYRFSKRYLREYFRQHGLPSLVHVHVPVKSGNLALWIKKKFGIPYVVSEQASTYCAEAPDNFFRRHRLYRSMVKRIFSGAVAVTNVSAAIGRVLQDLFSLKAVKVIHNVVDTSLFRLGLIRNEVFTFIHVSSLSEQKNIFGILNTFKRLAAIRSDWRLEVVGPLTKEIEQFVRDGKLTGNVSLVGEIPYAAVAKHMQKAHVLVLFSRHENFPCVVVEALCCGLPVVASDVAGIGEAVNATNGLLVASEDEEALLHALANVMETYQQYNTTAIAADAKERYSYPPIAKKFADLYKDLLLPR